MIKSILAIFASLASYFSRKQLIDAGKNEEKARAMEDFVDALEKAKRIDDSGIAGDDARRLLKADNDA